MIKSNSLGNRLIAFMLSIIMVLGMLPANVFALGSTAEAQIGDVTYDTLAEAIADVPTGTNQVAPAEVTTITLLRDTAYAFDVGTSTGATTMNLKLDLNDKTLTLSPSVGSVGTKSSGIRVLAYSKLEIVNGELVCSSTQEDNVKVGIANYGTLTLTDVTVKKGDLTRYTVNNRGALALNGKTTVESGSTCAITNDPYDLYYTTDVNASVTCNSSEVFVDSMLVERYERNSANQGGVELNISAGCFGKIVEDGESAVSTSYNVTGGTIGVSTTEELEFALNMVKAGAEYACPQQPVTIQLLNSIAGSFDVGTSTGKAPKNILLDLNENTLTLKPGVGSFNTKSNGIRVLAYSKLEIKNGTIICSSEEADNVKIGIANYSDLTLDSVAVNPGDLTVYTINNRGKLTLKGTTSVDDAKAPHGDYADSAELIAITNDPYNLYYSTPINAEINCADSNVVVGNIQLEIYGSKGDIELNITNGSFGGVYEPVVEGSVDVKGAISGGTFGTDVSEYCSEKFTSVEVDGKYVTQYVKDDQIDFAFADKEPEINFNDNAGNKYTFVVLNPKGTVTYTIESGSEYATINAGTGELTVIKPGVVTVKASDTGNDLYNPAEATYTLTINKDDQEISFATPVPEDQWIGAPFMNTVSGGNGTGEISYWLVDGENLVEEISGVAKIDKTTGELTFLCVGTQIAVKAVKVADDYYNETSATYTVTATKKEPTEVAFATTGPITITYNPENLSFKNNVVGCGEDDVITWSIVSGDAATLDTATGALTIKKTGTIVIKATVAESPYYFEKAIVYTLVINPANQADLNTDSIPTQITYSPDVQEGLIVGAGGSGTGAYGYEIVEGNEFAEINAQTGAIKILKAGNFVGDEFVNGVIKVKITKAGDDCYHAAEPVYVTISLARANQSGFSIGENKSATVTYNDNNNQYILNASGGQSTKDVEYIVYRYTGGDCATIDNSGVISIAHAGTAFIRATRPADDCYNAIADQFTLTIEKDEQDYSLTETGTIPLTYGTLSYTNDLIKGTYVSSTNKPVYTISQNSIGASVNAETGEVTFTDSEGKVGKATITVTVAEDDCYKQFTASYEIDVSYLTTNAVPTTDGETKNTSGWYTDKVVIKAPAGYTIAYDNKFSTEWKSEIPFTEEGINDATVYLKNSNGFITDKITVADIKLDTREPYDLAISYAEPIGKIILKTLTFGIYEVDELSVTVSAKDAASGIANLIYHYDGTDHVVGADELAEDRSCTFKIPAEYRNTVKLKAVDVAGRSIELADDMVIVLDNENPVMQPAYAVAQGVETHWENDILYAKNDVTVTFTITESNADLSGVELIDQDGAKTEMPVLTVNGDVVEIEEWKFDEEKKELIGSYPLTGEGDYRLRLTYKDPSGNNMEPYEKEVRIDHTAPVMTITNDTEGGNVNGLYFKDDRTVIVQIVEHNFDATKVDVAVTAENILGEDVTAAEIAEVKAHLSQPASWTPVEGKADTYEAQVTFATDARYTLTVNCSDIIGNAAEECKATDFVVDHTAPVDLDVTYSDPVENNFWQDALKVITFGAYNPEKDAPLVVTLTATDITSGVDYFEWFYTRETNASDINAESGSSENNNILYVSQMLEEEGVASYSASFEIDPQARGYITFRATDYAGNTYGVVEGNDDQWVADTDRINIVDTIAPGRTITWHDAIVYDEETNSLVNSVVEGDDVILHYYDKATITIDIAEANFYAEDVQVFVTTDPEDLSGAINYSNEVSWSSANADEHQGVVTIEQTDGDYYLVVMYTDRSGNEMVKYVSQSIHFDTTAPVISVSYDPAEGNVNGLYFKEDRVAKVTIVEHNFDSLKVEGIVTAKNILGQNVNAAEIAEVNAHLRQPASWTPVEGQVDTYEAEVTFATDAHYTFSVDCKDVIGNEAETYEAEPFVVDHTAPTNLQVDYSEPATNVWQNILATITFGAYNPNADKPLIVTVTATDITSGVDYFEWFYTREAGASEVNAPSGSAETANILYVAQMLEDEDEDPARFSASFEIEAETRGYVSFRATDYAGNTYGVVEGNDDQWVADTDRINIVDTIAPGRTVTLTPNAAYNAETLERVETFVEGENVILYYKERPVITIDIVEANFYAEDVQVFVTTDPEDLSGAINYSNEVSWSSANADEHQGVVTLKETDGDYYVVIMYTDRSLNEMVTYTSQRIVVDETLPEITVEYANKPENALNTLKDKDGNDRQYFFEDQTAVISIKEKNFRADDVKIYVKAQDLLGKNVNAATLTFDADGNVVQYFAQGVNRGEWEKLTPYETEWRREDNTYKLELHYSADANYTFDIVYADMATNEAKDYEPNYFTVDKVAPTPLAAEYSTEGVNVFDNILAGITFGFYDAKMTVTISASDEISGVHRFAYSYLKSEGVSPVNAELLNEAIESAKITQVDGTYTYMASFEIPKEVLTRDNQFNGTVEFSGFDRSENKSEAKSNTNRIIVDNIAPTATISYNAPVKQLGNVFYYAGNIDASIVINEANFYSEDVVVTVNDKPVSVSWSNNSVDVHTGTFVLSSDGDYVVKVTYTDRSTNKMEDYASNQLTIDTKAPVIQVSDVKHESANNGETISFTVQVTDRNIALENFKPTLSVLVKKDNGNNQYSFETAAIDLGQARTSVNSNGETVYTYSVENLEVDGFYSLVCKAVDHANHTVSTINSTNNADQNTTVETVNFSVNREGSVFWITTEHTEGDEIIVDQLQGKYVNGEVIVRIHEINVDKVDDGKATIFTLNDGSSAEHIVLDETNYKKNVSIGAGGWYQTDYTLDNSYFAKDGVYSINIITYDKATNSNVNTKSEEGTITFTVDRTKPVISANLTSRQIINDTQYKVYFQITELNLDTETIVVKYNGETVALENLGNNEYGFTVKEGLNQSVQITAVDLAGNESELFEAAPFTVSTNIFVRWYATGFWFWFPIIAVPLLIGLIILLIVLKKKKKER